MRHPAVIASLLLYLVFSAGVQVLVHTCGGHTTLDLMPVRAEDPCGCAGEQESDPCCTTELVTLELDVDQKVVVQQQTDPLLQQVFFVVASDDAPEPQGVIRVFPASASPPPGPSLTIRHCSLLI